MGFMRAGSTLGTGLATNPRLIGYGRSQMDLALFFSTLATLFAIMDPVGTVGIFIAITPGESESHRRNQALLGCCWALVFMAVFFLAGRQILDFFGITVDAVQVGGGLILLKIAFDQLAPSRQTRHTAQEDAASRLRSDVSVFPLAMPLIAGPGALTLMIAEAARGRSGSLEGWVSIGSAVLASLLIMWLALDRSVLIQRILGANGVGAITRLMGFMLACIAAQMTIVGIRGVVTNGQDAVAPAAETTKDATSRHDGPLPEGVHIGPLQPHHAWTLGLVTPGE